MESLSAEFQSFLASSSAQIDVAHNRTLQEYEAESTTLSGTDSEMDTNVLLEGSIGTMGTNLESSSQSMDLISVSQSLISRELKLLTYMFV